MKPLITMKVQVTEAAAIINFIEQIDPKTLKDKDIVVLVKTLDQALADVSMEKWRRKL